jgi:pimeloyl-[acyl-carrier protein] methyl ester esterase
MAPEALRAFRGALEQDWQQTLEDFVDLQLRGSSAAQDTRRTMLAALLDHGAPQPAALRAGLELLGSVDLRAAVARINVPVLLITGASDRVTPPAAARWLAQAIPDAGVIEIPRAGHAPLVSHHLQVAAALRALLSRVGSGVAA